MKNLKNIIVPALLLAAIVVWSAPLFAASADDLDPVPAYTTSQEIDTSPVKLPDITKKTLKNGLTVYYVPHKELPVVSMRLLVLSGSLYNPLEKPGVTDFMASMLSRGTENRTATQISEEIDFIGGSLSCGAGWNGSYVSASVLTRDMEKALELISDVALNPSFPEEEIERYRQQLVSGIMMGKSNPSNVADEQFAQFVYGDHSYAFPKGGTIESAQNISREDLVKQYEKLFVPGNAVLAIAGDFKVSKAKKLVKKYFKDWEKGENPVPEVSDPVRGKGHEILFVDKKDAVQSEIRMGYILGPSNLGKDKFPFMLMNYMFGGGGFSSRLMLKIRNELGLTYGIYSYLSSKQQNGAYGISGFTKTETTGMYIEESIKVMEKVLEEGFAEEELHDAKSFLISEYPSNFEVPSSIATQFQSILLFDLGNPSKYIKDYRKNINDVTLEEVNAAAKKYLNPDWLRFTIVGKADEAKEQVEKFGDVKVISIDEL